MLKIRPDPLGELKCSPRPHRLAAIWSLLLRGEGREGRRGREGRGRRKRTQTRLSGYATDWNK